MVSRTQTENEDPLVALKEALDRHGKFKTIEGLIVFDDLIHLRSIALRQAIRYNWPAKKNLDEQRIKALSEDD